MAMFVVCSRCSSLAAPVQEPTQPLMRSELPAGVTDSRVTFATIFCRHYRALEKGAPCDRWLYAAHPTASHNSTPVPIGARKIRDIVIIPGIFGECIDRWVTPYSTDYPYLEKLGYRVWVIPVTGRGSAAVNARIIHDFFATHKID